jgi:hypothetical protein
MAFVAGAAILLALLAHSSTRELRVAWWMAHGPVAKGASVDEAGCQEVEQLAQFPAEGLGLGGRLVKCYAPEKVILYSWMWRAGILMPTSLW